MKRKLNKTRKQIGKLATLTYVKFTLYTEKLSLIFMFTLGLALLTHGLENLSFAQDPDASGSVPEPVEFDTTELNNAICDMFQLLEGGFGALLATAAGFGAVFAAIFGSYKASYSFLVVAISGFIARSFVSIYFGTFDCTGDGTTPDPDGF